MTVAKITEWHRRARPTPDDKAFNVQLGCHFEEIAEMVETLTFNVDNWPATPGVNTMLHSALKMFADHLKRGEVTATVNDREGFLDSLADQTVTALGAGHCAKMDIEEAVARVNDSNWSKFVGGRPVFDENGKIAKPCTYRKPDLTGCY